jgi:hypothetical protein
LSAVDSATVSPSNSTPVTKTGRLYSWKAQNKDRKAKAGRHKTKTGRLYSWKAPWESI